MSEHLKWIGAMSDAPHTEEGMMTSNEAKRLADLFEDFNEKRRRIDELMVVDPADLTPDELAWYAETRRDAEEAVAAAWDKLTRARTKTA